MPKDFDPAWDKAFNVVQHVKPPFIPENGTATFKALLIGGSFPVEIIDHCVGQYFGFPAQLR